MYVHLIGYSLINQASNHITMGKLTKKNHSLAVVTLLVCIVSISVQPITSQASDIKRVIILETMPVKAVRDHTKWFVIQLEKLGYEQGENLEIVVLQANGDRKRAASLLNEFIAQGRPDLVVTNATLASQEAARLLKGKNIPQLFFTVSDPVGAGLIKKIGQPTGTHITGKVFSLRRESKIDMVLRLVGQTDPKRPMRFGFIHSSYPSSVGDIRELIKAADKRDDVEFITYQLEYKNVPEGLPAMIEDTLAGIEALKDSVDFWWEPSGPLGETKDYTEALLAHSQVPIAWGNKLDSVMLGALIHIAPQMEASGRETADLADAILKGADPGKIPPNSPNSFEVGLNLTTALKNQIVIPPDILDLAGENIFR